MRVLVTGAGGQLGRDLTDVFSGVVPAGGLDFAPSTGRPGRGSSCEVVGASRERLDVTRRHEVMAAVEGVRPDVIVHAAAFTAVDACESEPDKAFGVNAVGSRHVAEAARRWGAHVVYVSTDYVFDGRAERPYVEWDRPNPISVYGRSKRGGELEMADGATVVRTSWVCGFHGSNMVKTVLRLAGGSGELRFVDDQRGCPTFTADLAGALALLARERLPGVFHLTNDGATSWFDFARRVLLAAGDDPNRVASISTAELDPPRPAPRPANSVLDNAAWRALGLPALPPWEEALDRLVTALRADGGQSA